MARRSSDARPPGAADLRRLPGTVRANLSEPDARTARGQHRRPAGAGPAAHPAGGVRLRRRRRVGRADRGAQPADLRTWALRPRVLAGVAEVDLSTEVLGQRMAVPLLGAPTGLTGLVHHEGEVGIARAVHAAGGLYVLSSAASRNARGGRAGESGSAVVAALRRPRPRPRPRAARARPGRRLHGARGHGRRAALGRARARSAQRFHGAAAREARTLADGLLRPRWTADFLAGRGSCPKGCSRSIAAEGGAASLAELISRQFDPALSWGDIAWLQEQLGRADRCSRACCAPTTPVRRPGWEWPA